MGLLGKLNMKYKIKTQFLLFFILSFIVSIILSFVLFGLLMLLFDSKRTAYDIENYIVANKNKIFDQDFQAELNKKIPQTDFEYWIVSKDKSVLYTSSNSKQLPENITISSKEYHGKEGNEDNKKTYGISFKPLLDGESFQGGVILKYRSNTFVEIGVIDSLFRKIGPSWFLICFVFFPAFILLPLFIVTIFSILFSRGINRPLKEIVEASDQIKNGRLDFIIDTSYDNELGHVLKSFEEMRGALQSSLKTQWVMEEQRKDMILSLTHNIKTPITIICGHLELLAGSYNNISEDNRRKYINILLSNADKIRLMINELNEIWDLERPNFKMNMQDVNLKEYISELERDFSYICIEKKVNFLVSSSVESEETFNFDPFRINEVLENIISNSLKYVEIGGEVLLETYLEHKGLVLKLSDNGKGFSEETAIIFNKYYKGNTDVMYKNSSGLGLYICKLIVEKHGGEIFAYNNAKGGATLEILLPARHSEMYG